MTDRSSASPPAAPQASTQVTTTTTVVARVAVPSSELFQGRRELVIEHNGETYSLRQTSKGGLILTK